MRPEEVVVPSFAPNPPNPVEGVAVVPPRLKPVLPPVVLVVPPRLKPDVPDVELVMPPRLKPVLLNAVLGAPPRLKPVPAVEAVGAVPKPNGVVLAWLSPVAGVDVKRLPRVPAEEVRRGIGGQRSQRSSKDRQTHLK